MTVFTTRLLGGRRCATADADAQTLGHHQRDLCGNACSTISPTRSNCPPACASITRRSRRPARLASTAADEWQPRVTLTQHWTPTHMTLRVDRARLPRRRRQLAGPLRTLLPGRLGLDLRNRRQVHHRRHTLTLNTAIYYNDYQHYIGQNSLTPGAASRSTSTLATFKATALELEGNWRPNEIFQLQGGLTYNHARITDDSEYVRPSSARACRPTAFSSSRIGTSSSRRAITVPMRRRRHPLRHDRHLQGRPRRLELEPNVASRNLKATILVNANIAYEHATTGRWRSGAPT